MKNWLTTPVLRHHAGILLIRGFAQFGEVCLVIGKHQHMALRGVLVMPRNAVLGTEPLDELQIIFPVLSAVFARGTCFDVEGECIRVNTVPFEDLSDDFAAPSDSEKSAVDPG